MRLLGIIPARYESSRFPGKPLAIIHGKSMIQRVYNQASKTNILSNLVVATDDERIYNHVESFGGKVFMTDSNHPSGTDRCNEVLNKLKEQGQFYDVVINIQGDEPYINPIQIEQLAKAFDQKETEIATLIKAISSIEELQNPNVVKVVKSTKGKALYFSRFAIPFYREIDAEKALKMQPYYKHIGIYAYRSDVLSEICRLEKSNLEKAESLEQLRWLENGYHIHVNATDFESIAVDSPSDLLKLTNIS